MTQRPTSDSLTDDAIAWVVRVGDPAFDDWESFETWLGTSPAHADAYHAAAASEHELVEQMAAARGKPAALSSLETRPLRRRRLFPLGAAAAAAIAAAILFQMQPHGAPIVYETAPGMQRTVALADGSRMIMNGATRLTARAADPRSLTLERGEAFFTVRHDDRRPFSVAVGGAEVVDVGTRFDVLRADGETRVQVSEGSVDWKQSGGAVRLNAGRALRIADGSANAVLSDVSAAAVGSWSQGQLSFDNEALSDAAAALSRSLGTAIAVAPGIAQRPVRALIRLDGGADEVVPRFAALLGLRAERDGKGWRLGPST